MSAELVSHFRDHLLQSGHLRDDDHVVVALSGGLDSTVLLHLLRFTPGLPTVRLSAAHLDHGMRERSSEDARWVAGLARAWGVPLVREAAEPPPASEDEAREARYAFLERVRRDTEARWILTAHHADDQVETVLFRIARGTGLRGLRGIPEIRAPGIWRPLLPFTREELKAYAHQAGLRWRDDPTNRSDGYARNVLRHRVLPLLETAVSPRTREAVLRLARLARQDEDAWESLMPTLMSTLQVQHEPGGLSVSRDALLAHHPAVQARLLRALAARAGGRLDAAGTRLAVDFAASAASGRGISLTGGLELRRTLDLLVLAGEGAGGAPDVPLHLDGEGGEGQAVVGGVPFRVAWGSAAPSGRWTESFDAGALRWPLTLRGWLPGDRIRLGYGTKKLKKLFLEARRHRDERRRTPVLVDAGERVLWIPGLVRSAEAPASGTRDVLNVGVSDE